MMPNVTPPPGFTLDSSEEREGSQPSVRPPPGFALDSAKTGVSASPVSEKIYHNEAGQPFTLSGRPVPAVAADQGYTGSVLPLRKDEGGLHLAVPEMIAAPARGVVEGSQRAAGVGEAGRNPLRPLSPDEMAAAGLAAIRGVAGRSAPVAAAPSDAQRLLQDFTRAGVSPNAPTVGQGRSAGLASQIANTLPITGPQVRGAVTRTLADTASATEKQAGKIGSAQGAEQAGQALQRGTTSFVEGFKNTAERLYGRFDSLMEGAAPVPLTNTLKSLREPAERFTTIPELGEQITNPKLRSFAGTLAPKTKTVPEVLSSIVGPDGRPLLLKAAETIKLGGELTFGELREFRSAIGRMLGDPVLVNDIPRADLKRVYAGISSDMEIAARARGPDAFRAFRAANNFYRAGLERIDQIDDLLKGSAEQAFARINRAAQQGASADAGFLQTVKKSMPREWPEVGAAIVRRLGEPTPGAKDILGENFSPSSFATNWNKLSDRAKDVLFGGTTSVTRRGLDALSRISQAQKNVGKLANVSRSGEYGLMAGLAALAIEHYSTLIAHPFATVGSAASAYGISKLLMSPGFARWLYQLPKAVERTPPNVAAQRALATLQASMSPAPKAQPPSKPSLPPSVTDPYSQRIGAPP